MVSDLQQTYRDHRRDGLSRQQAMKQMASAMGVAYETVVSVLRQQEAVEHRLGPPRTERKPRHRTLRRQETQQ